MRTADVFPSKYLKAEDLDEDVQVTIKKVVLEELEDKKGEKASKPVIYFEEGTKGLIANKTNWSLIVKQHGDESDQWVGKKITLTVMDVDSFGDIVSAIRVKPLKKAGGGKAFPSKDTQKITPTDFWERVKVMYRVPNMTPEAREYGDRILAECGGDWDKAYDAVEQQIPPADERE